MARVIRWLLRHRLPVVLVLLASLAVAVRSALTLDVRFQFRDFYDYPGNPDMAVFNRYSADFGDPAGFVVILIEADDVFRHDVLAYVQTITRALEPEKIYSHVNSLSNANVIYAQGDDVVSGKLMPELPATAEQTERVRRVATGSTLLRRRLVASDGSATAVLAEMRTPAALASIAEQREAIEVAHRVLDGYAAPPGVRLRVTGGPVAEVESTRSLLHDLATLTPVALGLMLLALFLTFRSLQGIVLPLGAVSVAMVWTAGLFALFKRPVDIIGSTMPVTLLVYGVVDPIFVLTRFLDKIEAGRTRADAIVEAQTELALPCFLTSLTTALGFMSFGTAKLPTVAHYGFTVALGVILSWVTTVVVLPLLLSFIPPPRRRVRGLLRSPLLEAGFSRSWAWLRGRPRAVIAAAVLVLALGGVYGWKQHISSVYVANLPDGEALDAIHVLERKLSGVVRTVVTFEGEPGAMKRPEVLKAIAAIDAFVEKQPMVNTSISLADLVAEENQAFQGGDPAAAVVPASRALVAQYLALVDPVDLSDFVDEAFARSHLRVLTADPGSETFRELRRQLEAECTRELAGLGVRFALTGTAMIGYAALDEVVEDLLVGFAIGFGIIALFELILFRSLRIALISVVANLIPVVASFCYLRRFGITLRMDTSLFLSVCIGGLFNTTIHFAARVRQQVAAGETDPDDIIARAMRAIGPPALFTAAVLSLGFASFMLSGFAGLRALGMISAITLTVGFFSDMVVTSALIRVFWKWKGGT
jgi:predicted RND superfamily exporter protein